VELDRNFQAQGFAVGKSLEWTCRALQKLRESSDWSLPVRELSLVLLRLAGAVQREAQERPERPATPERRLSDYERKRLAKDLDRLPTGELEILTCWADSSYSEEEIATLLHIAPGEIQRALGSVFGTWDRPTEGLRGTAFAEVCKDVLRHRVGT